MPYHFFSDTQSATPGYGTLLKFWDRTPRQLRTGLRYELPVIPINRENYSEGVFKVIRATEDDAVKIANLWNAHYKHETWTLRVSPLTVIDALRRGIILIIKHENAVIASFVCRVLAAGIWCGKPTSCGLLEGFVIHEQWRRRGLGSLLLAHMDYQTFRDSRLATGMLMYFRELSHPDTAYSQAPINISKYFVCEITKIKRDSKIIISEPLPEMVSKIVADVHDFLITNYSDATLVSKDTTDKDVRWIFVDNFLIGIADTHRLERGKPVYEIVFCSEISRPYFKQRILGLKLIQQAATELPINEGLLYASTSLTRGNFLVDATYNDLGWVAAGGFLSCHVYNWMPPWFMNGVILFPHSCI